MYDKLISENEEAAREALIKVSEGNPIFVESYNPDIPFGEHSVMLQACAKAELKKQFPELFKAIDKEEGERVGKIDGKIETLQAHARTKIS